MKKRLIISVSIIFLFLPVCAQNNYIYPLQLSSGNLYLIDQKGTPFFWSGEAAWSLIAQLSKADIDYYLDNRKEKGFTVIMVNLIEHKFCTYAPDNYYHEPPFTTKPFITPNEQIPAQPFFMMESAYENEHQSSARRLRSEAYWPVLCGGTGHIFGNCPIWHFGAHAGWCNLTDWKSELDNTGSVSMDHLQHLFRSRSWHLLVPDFSHRVLTEGYGTWGKEDYATAACTSDGSTIIAYLPTSRQITIDMTNISVEKAKCLWYNPSSGEFKKSEFLKQKAPSSSLLLQMAIG